MGELDSLKPGDLVVVKIWSDAELLRVPGIIVYKYDKMLIIFRVNGQNQIDSPPHVMALATVDDVLKYVDDYEILIKAAEEYEAR